MKAIACNDGWAYRHLDSTEAFTPVDLPHDAMLYEPRFKDAPGGTNTGWFEGRDYEYVRRFTPGTVLAGKTLLLEFEGVYEHAQVFVNDLEVGSCAYGYTGFTVDITDAVNSDPNQSNEIRVIARNADQPNSRWYSGAGIYRPVTLWVGPRRHIEHEGIRIRTLSVNPAKAEITVKASAAGNIHIDIFELPDTSCDSNTSHTVDISNTSDGSQNSRHKPQATPVVSADADTDALGTATFTISIPNAKLWSPENPHLYTCRAYYKAADNGNTTPPHSTNANGNVTDNTASIRPLDGANDALNDTDSTTFGIRTLEWGRNGFLINGKRTIIQGACVHHTNGILGAAAFEEAEERKVQSLKAQGYNAIRSSHNPCSKAMLDVCDRLGMLVLDEYIDHWYIHKTLNDYVRYFDDNWRNDLSAMVAKDRNHPSVVMYSIGNEVSETAEERGIRLTGIMTDSLHRLDPTRPVTCGINIFFNFLSSIGFGVYSDEKARKEVEAAHRNQRSLNANGDAMLPSSAKHSAPAIVPGACVINSEESAAEKPAKRGKHKAVGSEFFNTMAGLLGAGFMKTGATLHACDVKTRDAFAKLDIAGYNYGIKRYAKDLRHYPDRLILGSETFCSDAYRFREMAKRNPRLIGDFVWAGMDYMGETSVGAWEYADYAPRSNGFGWLTAGSGRLDLTGRATGEALYTRVALEQSAGPYIAVRPVNHTGDKHSPSAWKMTDALPSWSWEDCEGRKARIEVYARADTVSLLLNGREVGRKRLGDGCTANFSCAYHPGMLEAVSYNRQGEEIGRCTMHSAQGPTMLTASIEAPEGFDGHGIDWQSSADTLPEGSLSASALTARKSKRHLAYVRVRYTDSEGITKPLERGTLRATVTGAKLMAFGCAAPYNTGSFVTDTTDTYYGEALAIIELTGKAGTQPFQPVTLEITDGTLSASLVISD
ncbi:glycoside hydrolase family 2 TIM barrel-domain containing protein [Bifidobacterium sp. ESL0745]|uniref:glycoside hydrolase family 2 TIM barrel-domain containing protein n=1 Tax=Bifidobacterium sp. ESL0745 TaxID=2983226 RepID=UPI0023F86DDA|nr:glycoside hydrolase family 2 TIM barrel-domain containing protein [Bifidobacterium sp. ESL0745]MDF7666153.1 glycoside hydrolase family 2 TIM barrel-domain containing protein [Bifidobacterium sp. ESL0745]